MTKLEPIIIESACHPTDGLAATANGDTVVLTCKTCDAIVVCVWVDAGRAAAAAEETPDNEPTNLRTREMDS